MVGLVLWLTMSALGGERLTVLHTNDWQSRLLGFGPNAEYSPATTGDDDTIGGVARLATLIEARRAAADGAVLLVDGGDWTMGTLFHTVTRETGSELQLMAMLGYDAVTVGNHELDFRPAGLAQMISSAKAGQGAPTILATNLTLDPSDPRDDGLEAHLASGAIRRTLVLERGGLKVGLIGLLGEDAHEVMGQAEPVGIVSPNDAAQAAADELTAAGAEVVLVLSHSGVEQRDGLWSGPDLDTAERVRGIHAVIGGHSHTPLHSPLLASTGVPVVQAGSDGRYLGELVLDVSDGRVSVLSYTLHPIDDQTLGDPDVQAFVDEIKAQVSSRVLPPGRGFDQPLATVSRDLTRRFDDAVLGNLVTDAYREATGADIAFTGNGTLRDDIVRGRTGVQRTSDLFRVSGLGIGTLDDDPGYDLMVSYFTGADLKAVLEFLLVGYKLKGRKYYPRLSGLQVVSNDRRVLFDRVSEVRIGSDDAGYEVVDLWGDRLFSVATTTYIGGFLPTVSKTSKGILSAQLRHADGTLASDPTALLYDRDKSVPGTQPLKAWTAVLDHLSSQPDTDGDGLANLPSEGAIATSRLIEQPSWSPGALFSNSTWRQRSVVGLPLGVGGALVALIAWWRRRR